MAYRRSITKQADKEECRDRTPLHSSNAQAADARATGSDDSSAVICSRTSTSSVAGL